MANFATSMKASSGSAPPPIPPEGHSLEVKNYLDPTHTLVLSDADNYLRMFSSEDTSITIPLNASVAFRIGTVIYIEQAGTGIVTFNALGILHIRSSRLPSTAERWAVARLIKVATDTWVLHGELATEEPGPDPDPDPIEGVLTDSIGNVLTNTAGDILVFGSSTPPGPRS